MQLSPTASRDSSSDSVERVADNHEAGSASLSCPIMEREPVKAPARFAKPMVLGNWDQVRVLRAPSNPS